MVDDKLTKKMIENEMIIDRNENTIFEEMKNKKVSPCVNTITSVKVKGIIF